MPHRPLNLGSQAAFTVEPLMLWRAQWQLANQPIEGVVAILAEYGFLWRCHERELRKTEVLALSIDGIASGGNYQN
ncbi:hypothetical protein D3C71_1353740 [compost metagenome]